VCHRPRRCGCLVGATPLGWLPLVSRQQLLFRIDWAKASLSKTGSSFPQSALLRPKTEKPSGLLENNMMTVSGDEIDMTNECLRINQLI